MSFTALHESPWQGSCYVTGGGSAFLARLLTTPGASATVLDAQIPYSTSALNQLLHGEISSFCSKETSCAMAMEAFRNSLHENDPAHVFGFACTASLRSVERKRGPHRAHVALQTLNRTSHWQLDFKKDELTRQAEEKQLATQLGQILLNGLGLESSLSLAPDAHAEVDEEISALVLGFRSTLYESAHAFLPGAFNPLHAGHKRMKEVAENLLEQPVQYELSIRNVDKPHMDYIELQKRIGQFKAGSYVLSDLPTFAEKNRKLATEASATFIIGLDTLERLIDAKYYHNSNVLRDEAIDEMIQRGTRFVVFGRLYENRFLTLGDLDLPAELRQACIEVPEEDFRADISSTQLRNV